MRLFRKYFLNHNKTLMILNCAIIDEDPSALELLKKYVDETPTLNLIGAYPSAIDAVDGIRHSHLDILFLAIHMQQISGLEFAKVVPKKDHLHHSLQGVCHRSLQSSCFRLSAKTNQLSGFHGFLQEGFRFLHAGRQIQPYQTRQVPDCKKRLQICPHTVRQDSIRRKPEGLYPFPSGGNGERIDLGQSQASGRTASEREIPKSAPLLSCQPEQVRLYRAWQIDIRFDGRPYLRYVLRGNQKLYR